MVQPKMKRMVTVLLGFSVLAITCRVAEAHPQLEESSASVDLPAYRQRVGCGDAWSIVGEAAAVAQLAMLPAVGVVRRQVGWQSNWRFTGRRQIRPGS